MNRPTPITRRAFLETSTFSALAATACSVAPSSSPGSRGGDPVVDTHLHCFAGRADPRFPYHERAPYRPDEPATPQHLLRCMDSAGVDHAIVVHPEPYQDDHRYLETCLEVGGGRLKGTALVFADRAGSVEKLAPLAARTDLVAARIHAYAPDRLPPFGKPELRHLWKTAADLGLAVQLHFEPRYAPGFESLIEEFSETTVIIDHMGRPFQGTVDQHAVVLAWSRFRNTVMKLSSVPPQRQYPHRDIAPVIRQLVERYGPDRMIYGGGFGAAATGASYRETRERYRQYIAFLNAADQAKIFGGTAVRLFGFPA